MDDAAFRRQFPGLTVIDPVALLRELAPAPEPKPDQEAGEAEGQGRSNEGG